MKWLFPNDVVDDVLSRITGANPQLRPPSPDRTTLAELLGSVYYASLLEEEGRRHVIRVALVNPSDPQIPEKGTWFWSHLGLKQSRPCTPKEIAKLAPAVDPRQSVICVWPEESSLRIWGITRLGTGCYRDARDEGRTEIQTAVRYLLVTAPGPGVLQVDTPAGRLLALHHGEMTPGGTLRDGDGLVHRFLLDCARHEKRLPETSQFSLRHAINGLLRRAQDGRRGGSLVLLADHLDDKSGFETIKYHVHASFADLLDRLVVLAQTDEALVRDRYMYYPEGNDKPDNRVPLQCVYHVGERSWAEQEYTDALDAYSRLMNVDGAVVLGPDLAVRGFGAVIAAGEEPEVQQAHDVWGQNTTPYSMATKGTRHRSAARLAKARTDALVFVVSQDGPVSCFARGEGDKVLVWTPVQLEWHFTADRRDEPPRGGKEMPAWARNGGLRPPHEGG